MLGQPNHLHTLTYIASRQRRSPTLNGSRSWLRSFHILLLYAAYFWLRASALACALGVWITRSVDRAHLKSSLSLYSSCFDFHMHAGESAADWRVSQQRDVCALIVPSSRALTSARDRLPPRQAAWARTLARDKQARSRLWGGNHGNQRTHFELPVLEARQ